MDRNDLLEKINALNVWKQGDQRAPHKPLLLLYALGRLQQNKTRLIPYAEVDRTLRELLIEFGPSRARYHPEYPFWRLQNDGIWALTQTEGLARRRSNTDPTRRALLDNDVVGGFPKPIYELLIRNPSLVGKITQLILQEHFPSSMHQDILDAVGLEFETPQTNRRKRDAAFRERVLRAYTYRCAICGFDIRIDNRTIGLEAAHIKWHQAGGPDIEENGIALCTMHHKLLDRGAFRITSDYRMRVSERVHGTSGVEEWLLRYHDAPVGQPQRSAYQLDSTYLSWHVREVFKGPERSLDL
jgi:putative restriction endonuclease